MTANWRAYRPAIWLAILGLALILLMSPPYIGAVLVGAAIGVSIRIRQRRGRAAAGASQGTRPRR